MQESTKQVGSEVRTGMLTEIAVGWEVTPCSLVEFADLSEDISVYIIKLYDGGGRAHSEHHIYK